MTEAQSSQSGVPMLCPECSKGFLVADAARVAAADQFVACPYCKAALPGLATRQATLISDEWFAVWVLAADRFETGQLKVRTGAVAHVSISPPFGEVYRESLRLEQRAGSRDILVVGASITPRGFQIVSSDVQPSHVPGAVVRWYLWGKSTKGPPTNPQEIARELLQEARIRGFLEDYRRQVLESAVAWEALVDAYTEDVWPSEAVMPTDMAKYVRKAPLFEKTLWVAAALAQRLGPTHDLSQGTKRRLQALQDLRNRIVHARCVKVTRAQGSRAFEGVLRLVSELAGEPWCPAGKTPEQDEE